MGHLLGMVGVPCGTAFGFAENWRSSINEQFDRATQAKAACLLHVLVHIVRWRSAGLQRKGTQAVHQQLAMLAARASSLRFALSTVDGRERGDRGLQGIELQLCVAAVHLAVGVAGELHPHFVGHARVSKMRDETVPKAVRRDPLGE